jgi:exosortase A-associated hydrolase 2
VVYVHPFAEEMNKCRRMAAMQARALADAGFAVLQMDLLGCGDSGGDFGDASWERWVDDIVDACRWLRREHATSAEYASVPLWLWGMRVGCLLAVAAAVKLNEDCCFLFWQPTIAGNVALRQFLRLRLASEMLGGKAKVDVATLQRQLAAGQALEVGGYLLAPPLATGLELAYLKPPQMPPRMVAWLEVANASEAALAPASERAICAVGASGLRREKTSCQRSNLLAEHRNRRGASSSALDRRRFVGRACGCDFARTGL